MKEYRWYNKKTMKGYARMWWGVWGF